MARSKVLHMFAHMHTLYGDGVSARKLYFFKLDADTLVHPYNLRSLLTSLAPLARSPAEPMLLGLASCRSSHAPELCHAAGGGGYALTPPALAILARFVATGLTPSWLAHLDDLTYGGEDVAVALALHETGGVSVVNVGGFHQHPPEKYKFYKMDGVQWPTVRPLTFHNLRLGALMSQLFHCTFYHREREPTAPKGRAGTTLAVAPPRPRCFTPKFWDVTLSVMIVAQILAWPITAPLK